MLKCPASPLNFGFKLGDLHSQLAFELSQLLLWVMLALYKLPLHMCHHAKKPIIELVLVLNLLEVLPQYLLLILHLLLIHNDLIGMWEGLHSFNKLSQVLKLDNRVVDLLLVAVLYLAGGKHWLPRFVEDLLWLMLRCVTVWRNVEDSLEIEGGRLVLGGMWREEGTLSIFLSVVGDKDLLREQALPVTLVGTVELVVFE
jgi:hypothetical protein